MDPNKFFQTKIFQTVTWLIAAVIILLLVFWAGLNVGFKKAGFSYRWGENYHNNFAGPQGGFGQKLGGRGFMEASGTFGQIIKIDGKNIVVKGENNSEKIVLIKDDTAIKQFQKTVDPADLKIDDYNVTIGNPNDAGQIEAKLIRIMPGAPDEFFDASTSPEFLPPPGCLLSDRERPATGTGCPMNPR